MNVTAPAGDTLIQASGSTPLETGSVKRALRTALRIRRKAIPLSTRRSAAAAVARRALRCKALRRARRVAVYWSMGSEMATAPLIALLRARGVSVFVPVLLSGGMRFHPLGHGSLRRHRLGMMQVRRGPALRASAMDVVLLPLLGFDARGTRLGQGGGWYDRALARAPFRPFRLGLGYALQEVEALPHEPWDQYLHAVLTERRLHRFPRKLFG